MSTIREQAIIAGHTCSWKLTLTDDTSCLKLCLFFSWCATNQQVLNVILEHDNDEESTQDNSLSNDVLVRKAGQKHANEDVGNPQGQRRSAQRPMTQIPNTPQV